MNFKVRNNRPLCDVEPDPAHIVNKMVYEISGLTLLRDNLDAILDVLGE